MKKVALATMAGLMAWAIIPAAHAAGDVAAGEDVFKKQCTTCHTNEPDKYKVGPSLFGVFTRKAGTSNFPRYKGLVGADFMWTPDLMNEYLADPKAFVIAHTANKTTAMTYKVKDEQDRLNVIAYLQTLK